MVKMIYVLIFVFLTGCASVGFDGVEVNPDDTWFTIIAPIVILIGLYFVKKEIDLWYVKKELRLRRIDEKDKSNKNGIE